MLKSYVAGTSPPRVANIKSLSGYSKLPDLAELKEVFNMQHLVRCIEWMYFNSTEYHIGEMNQDNLFRYMKYGRYPAARRRFPACLGEDILEVENATLESFQDRFYRAMYRILLAGAVHARVYMAPLFQAIEEGGRDTFFAQMGGPDCFYASKHWEKNIAVEERDRPEDVAYVRSFPVYNYDVADWSDIGLWRNREYEECFGPFASWIVEDGKKRQLSQSADRQGPMPDWAEAPSDVGAVRELMLLLVAYDHFNGKFSNNREAHRGQLPPYLKKRENRTVSIVRFGTFQLEQVTMPAAFEDLGTGHLHKDYHPALEGTPGEDFPIMFDVWWATMPLLDRMKRIPYNDDRENPGPPAMLELWHFALRRYLNLGFKRGMFWMPKMPMYERSIWWEEVGRGEIFVSPNWAPVIKYKPGVISWE